MATRKKKTAARSKSFSKQAAVAPSQSKDTVNNQLQSKVEELERANDDIRNLFHSTEIATVFLDTHKRIRRFTPATQLLNVLETDIGRPIGDLALKFTDNTLLQDVERVLDKLAPVEAEIRSDAGNWYLRRVLPYRTADNRIEGVAITFVEITERMKNKAELEERVRQRTAELEAANLELRRREQEFRTLADNVPALFSYVDVRERLRFVNKRYEDLFGRPPQQLVGKTVEDLLGPEVYQSVKPHIAQVLSGKPVRYSGEFVLPAGKRFCQVSYVPDLDESGKVVGFFTLVNDLTDGKRTEDELGEKTRRLQAIVETAADAIITIDERGRIDSFNSAAERMFGYSAQEAIGQNVMLLMPPPHREEHDSYLARYLKTGEAHIIGIGRELVARRKDGSTFPIDLSVSELPDGTGPIFTGIIRDLSERQALQKELLTILSEEQRRIGQDLHDVVGQELTGLGLLAGSLIESLKERRPPDPDFGIVERIASGITSSLEHVRKLSKGLIPVEVDAEGLSAALMELAEKTSRNSRVRCEFDCARPVGIDNNETATHLFRIAQEAVSNALKHAACRRIRITLETEEDRIILCVYDDGKGIPPTAWEAEGMGLKTMQYRAGLIGATLSVAPIKKGGTLVTCQFLEGRDHGQTRHVE
jgi:PAS domain S-box-containing protein